VKEGVSELRVSEAVSVTTLIYLLARIKLSAGNLNYCNDRRSPNNPNILNNSNGPNNLTLVTLITRMMHDRNYFNGKQYLL
jgi:hypothetical protein